MKQKYFQILIFLITQLPAFPQGSWTPPGFEPSHPRTYPDSLAVPAVRASLSDPDHLSLFTSVWNNANAAIPAGNTTWQDRAVRSDIAKEAAFCYLMDRKVSAGMVVPLTPAGKDSLKIRVIGLLEEMNNEVDVGTFWSFYIPWQNRSKELISYLIACDLLLGAGVAPAELDASKTKLLTFAANLYQRSMASYTFLNLKFFSYQVNNHSIMTASALGLAAVMFNDNVSTNVNYQPVNWINAGFYNLDNTLYMESGTYPRVSEPDTLAGYAEGPNYLKYGFENAFPFIRAMGNVLPDGYYPVTFNSTTRNLRNPWYDNRYDRLYDWMNKIRMPDGSVPAIHDSYLGFGSVIMALSGKPQFNVTNIFMSADEPWIRSQYIATNIPHGPVTDSLFQALPAAGSLVFRSSWQWQAVAMHFIGKHGIALTGAKSHHQGDASSFMIHGYGELLAVDPGYPGASLADLENKAIDHSLILVNGAGPLPPTGELVSTTTNTAYIEHCFDTPLLDYGEVRVSYQGADIVRRNLFVRNSYFLLSDFVTSSSAKNYTWQLHGNGLFGAQPASPTGAFLPDFSNSKGIYARTSASLLARVTATGGTSGFTYELDSMVILGGFRQYSKMLVQKNGVAQTIFLSTLFPFAGEPPQISSAPQSSVLTSARIQSNGYNDLLFSLLDNLPHTLPSDSTGLGKTVTGNGKINFLSESVAGSFSSAFLQNGDSLIAGSRTMIRTGRKLDVAWARADSAIWSGFVSDTGLVWLYATVPLQLLSGTASTASWDPVRGVMQFRFTQKGNFVCGPQDLTWVWTGASDTAWHNPANWQMQEHTWVHGVPAATNNVVIPAGVSNMPKVSSNDPACCHDLTIEAGATLEVDALKFLTVEGSVTVAGAP